MTAWTWGWAGWLAWFAVEEGLALWRGGAGATLSAHVWTWFALENTDKRRTAWVRFRRFALIAFMSWLTYHFLTGGRA